MLVHIPITHRNDTDAGADANTVEDDDEGVADECNESSSVSNAADARDDRSLFSIESRSSMIVIWRAAGDAGSRDDADVEEENGSCGAGASVGDSSS